MKRLLHLAAVALLALPVVLHAQPSEPDDAELRQRVGVDLFKPSPEPATEGKEKP